MYKIIGTDQKEYGPVSSDQIRQWISQGRVNAQTKAQSDGGEWKAIGDFPEFASLFGPAVPPRASSIPANIPPAARALPTSGLAIASLVLGILGIISCGLTALIGLILGIVSMSQVRKSDGTLGGGGIALAGTIVSAVFLLFTIPFGAAMLLPALSKAKERALTIKCENNVRLISLAARIYSTEHDDHFPAANNWCDALKQYIGNADVYKCEAANSGERCDYTYNSRLAGLETRNVNPQTVLFFEGGSGWNLSSDTLPVANAVPRHKTRSRKQAIVVAFADGHVEEVEFDRVSQLRWEP